ncbi:membrane-associated HD superfamily phosphohydrolase [Sedimentibacter acidaminivorans]|uniref:Membrane-associated HD superfamily phosphohydrolase n=1 Tax=Sedimentibacter acidaminivorans TaxID=913099 RepID=A0ABS4GFR5_9FIRM|nr:hypothetical protein [Sedimentibacter acidaminivorans]MBP1926524.1 membrane-associated HD superfamily phosphohydrolase [Sedimentibacter acidaminivorans]
MNKLKLFLFSISPFVIGYLLNYLITKLNWYGIRIFIFSIVFVLYWFFIGYKSYDYVENMKQSILIGNSFAIVSIILVLIQEIILKRYLINIIGFLSQMYYLPIMGLISVILRKILFFASIQYMWYTYILSFALMIFIYYKGYIKKKLSKIEIE